MPKPDYPTAAPFVPATSDLDVLRAESDGCRGGPLYENATQAVFGAGPGGARVVLVHATPDTYEVAACTPWLTAELSLLQPDVVVQLGATAAKSMLGPSFRVTQSRGVLMPFGRSQALATLHPSAVLRSDDREGARAGLVADLRVAASVLT